VRVYPEKLSATLTRGLAPIYVVGGDEPLLVEEALDAIREAARKQGYSEREVLEVDPSFDWQRLIEAYASLSLFASRRLIELRMPRGITGGKRKSADDEGDGEAEKGSGSGAKILPELAKNPAPDTILLVVCGKLDWRARQSGWWVALENAGASLYAEAIKADRLPGWLQSRLKQAGLSADREAIQLLAERTEGHLLAAKQDIDKLKLLFPKGPIGAEEIRAAVADSARFEAFDLADKILSGDATGAARALQRLRDEGEEIPKLLGALVYDLRTWANAALLKEKTGNAAQAVEQARIWRSRQPNFIKGLERATSAQILGWIARCADIDEHFKNNRKEQAWEELLSFVEAACGVTQITLQPAA